MKMTEIIASIPKNPKENEFYEKESLTRLSEVISNIKDGDDIEGAILINERDDTIVSAFSNSINRKIKMTEIISLLYSLKDPMIGKTNDTFFTQRIFDYNGLKVLTKNIMERLTLLVFLKKRCYISLVMLDVENSTRRIHEIMLGYRVQKTSNL
jgi:hypothetical protein